MIYRHTQIGWVVVGVTGLVLLALLLPAHAASPAAAAILLAVLILFCCLTVTVDAERIDVRFGPGPIRFRIPLADVRSCRIVRNPWIAGWGIRWIGSGWLYNVSGLDAVELALTNGKVCRIGTDEPEALCAAIEQAVAQRA